MGLGYGAFEGIFFLVFAVGIGMFLVMAVRGISMWNKNNHSPCLTITAKIVSKRTHASHHSRPNAGDMTGAHGYAADTSKSYYVAFQAGSGDIMEFLVKGSEYRKLAEGDVGELTFQGTRYLSFERS